MTSTRIIELFAGAGGWSQGLKSIGRTDAVGVEWDVVACETARAAGHARVQADVAALDPVRFAIGHGASAPEGLICSPPCTGFSLAGKGLGRGDTPAILAALPEVAAAPHRRIGFAGADPRSALVLEPLRWALALRPEWMAWEQVPAVLPLWQACAGQMAAQGYSVWTGILHAEQYGVPQTRKRAILIASRTSAVSAPVPTHSRYYSRDPQRLDPGMPRWVSMTDALGWGATMRPAMTVTGGGTATGGADPFGNAARKGLLREMEAGRWAPRSEPGIRPSLAEAATLQSFPAGCSWAGNQGQQFRQVGDAVPPLLAAHVLAAAGAARPALERAG